MNEEDFIQRMIVCKQPETEMLNTNIRGGEKLIEINFKMR